MTREEDGIIILNKPKKISSFAIINKIKKRLNLKKIGHAGTLDPLATGVLVVLINNATKLNDFLVSDTKTYEGEIILGASSETLDLESELKFIEPTSFTIEKLKEVAASFIGDSLQVPPIYSAIKVSGKPLYKYALSGEEVLLKPRPITIKKFEITNLKCYKAHQVIHFLLDCSKGTYVRSLARDFGERLESAAVLKNLCRTRSGAFFLKDAINYKDIVFGSFKLLKMHSAFNKFYELSEEEYKQVKNGNLLTIDSNKALLPLVYEDKLRAIYIRKKKGVYKAKRVWN